MPGKYPVHRVVVWVLRKTKQANMFVSSVVAYLSIYIHILSRKAKKKEMFYEEGGTRAATLTCPIMGGGKKSKGKNETSKRHSIFYYYFFSNFLFGERRRDGARGLN